MTCQEGIVRIYDECIAEIFEGEELSEDEKLDFELVREAIITNLIKDITSKEDEEFFLSNIDLYKQFIMAMITDDKRGMKITLIELLKLKRIGTTIAQQ